LDNNPGYKDYDIIVSDNKKFHCTYYDNGRLRYETPYVNNLVNGTEKTYYESSGAIHWFTYYVNGSVEGTEWGFYENGQVREQSATYIHGVQYSGIRYLYYENGQLEWEIPYANGE